MDTRPNFPPPFHLGPWLVLPDLNRVRGPSGEIQIEPRVMQVLLVLAARPGDVVSRNQLLDDVWADSVVGEENLTRAISELRRIFGDQARRPRYIETIRQHGYRLIMPLTGPDTAPAPQSQPAGAARPEQDQPRPGSRQRRPLVIRLLLLLTLLIAAALIVVKLAGTWDGGRGGGQAGLSPNLPGIPQTSLPGREWHPALSADGSRLAFAWGGQDGQDVQLYLKQRQGATTLRLTDLPGWIAWPTWSPDAQTVAFVQAEDTLGVICTVSAIGGPVRRLLSVSWPIEGLDWSPDGSRLAYSAQPDSGGSQRIFLLSLENLQSRVLPLLRPGGAGDIQPRFSPDGNSLAWVGMDQTGTAGLFVTGLARPEAAEVITGLADLQGFAWTASGRELVFSAAPAGVYNLWRVSLTGGPVDWIPTPGGFAWNPTIARETGEMVWEQVEFDQDIWRIEVQGQEPWQLATGPLINSTRWEFEPAFSPDGGRLVFVSTRSGYPELWVTDAAGRQARQLTDLRAAGITNPRWSPDGKLIAFNAVRAGAMNVLLVEASGGPVRSLDAGPGQEIFSAWTRDGRGLLVANDSVGTWQIYRRGLANEESRRLTSDGGMIAQESPDGAYLYFTRPVRPGLWRLPLGEGAEVSREPELILADLTQQDRFNWVVREDRIAWVVRYGNTAYLAWYDLASGRSVPMTALPGLAASGLAISPGLESILYTRAGRFTGDLLLVEEF